MQSRPEILLQICCHKSDAQQIKVDVLIKSRKILYNKILTNCSDRGTRKRHFFQAIISERSQNEHNFWQFFYLIVNNHALTKSNRSTHMVSFQNISLSCSIIQGFNYCQTTFFDPWSCKFATGRRIVFDAVFTSTTRTLQCFFLKRTSYDSRFLRWLVGSVANTTYPTFTFVVSLYHFERNRAMFGTPLLTSDCTNG